MFCFLVSPLCVVQLNLLTLDVTPNKQTNKSTKENEKRDQDREKTDLQVPHPPRDFLRDLPRLAACDVGLDVENDGGRGWCAEVLGFSNITLTLTHPQRSRRRAEK